MEPPETPGRFGLPGRGDCGGASTPRLTCQRMNASSARRYARIGTRPGWPS